MLPNPQSLVILHDYFEFPDGGGRLCALLAEATKADLIYGFRTNEHPYFDTFNLHRTYSLKSKSSVPLWKQMKLAHRFTYSTQNISNYATALYSGTYSPLAAINHAAKRNILYCHTPPRFIYDKQDFYLSLLPYWKRLVLVQFIHYMQVRYEKAVERMDMILANSVSVKNRIQQYLGKSSEVVYPPCDTHKFRWYGQQKYYLSTARLDSLKQVELSIEAFRRMPEKTLLVTSDGPLRGRLQKLSTGLKNIHFTGQVSESRIRELMGNAIATLYLPVDEDFGMSPVESMAAGKPVIGVASGGMLETVISGETGILLTPDSHTDDIIAAVQWMSRSRAEKMRIACENRALKFSKERFLNQMRSLMAQAE